MFNRIKYRIYRILQDASNQELDKAVKTGDAASIAAYSGAVKNFGRKALGYSMILGKNREETDIIQERIETACITKIALEALIAQPA